VERTDRQWFFDLRRPESTAVVEMGLKSFEGYFVRIARSGRVDFPRKEPAPPGGVEWLTVRAASGGLTPRVPAPGSAAGPPVGLGGSERRAGASERRWIGASELRLGGASEIWRLGATEIRFLGASERLSGGASERRLQGASERRLEGASERAYGGASEQ